MSPRRFSLAGSLRPAMTSLRAAMAPSRAPPPERARARYVGRGVAASIVAAGLVAIGLAGWHRATPHGKVVPMVVSGKAGLRTTSSGAHVRWTVGAVTVSVDPSILALGPGAKDAIVSAYGAWMSTGAHVPDVSVDTASAPGEVARDGVNRVLVGKVETPGEGDVLALTTSFVDDASGDVLEADTVFNEKYVFGILSPRPGESPRAGEGGEDTCGDVYDLQNVATHEAGHFFGLGEDYSETAATMYYESLPCQTHKRTPIPLDVTVMSGLYSGSGPGGGASQQAQGGCSHR